MRIYDYNKEQLLLKCYTDMPSFSTQVEKVCMMRKRTILNYRNLTYIYKEEGMIVTGLFLISIINLSIVMMTV